MRKFIIIFFCVLNTSLALSQTLGGYHINDYLVSAVHPNGCYSGYVTGPPDDSAWVNFNGGDITTGFFGSKWTDRTGDDLLLETGFNTANYTVRLILSTGLYSSQHNVYTTDWTSITNINWKWLHRTCYSSSSPYERYILPLDFITDFSLSTADTVTGIEITFVNCTGAPDLAGVYIIQEAPCDSINFGNDTTLCIGETLTLDATRLNTTYLWQDNSTNPTLNITQQGTYWVEITNICGSTSDTINVSFNFAPNINLGNDTTLCLGDTLTLDATRLNTTYLWQDNSTNSTLNVTQQGTYRVQTTNNCGIASDAINVNFISAPNIYLGNDTTLCNGEALLLNATRLNTTYLWQDNSTNPTKNITQQGTYWVEIINICGSVSDTINVSFNSAPNINLGNDTTICLKETLTLDVTSLKTKTNYLWQDNTTNPTLNITQQGTYWVQTTNYCGTTTDTINVAFEDCEIILEMPNFFTPNSDETNDYFHPIQINGIKQAILIIYNRWGQKIIETDDILTGWDGKYNNTNCSDGTYFWVIKYVSNKNVFNTLKGFLTLIK